MSWKVRATDGRWSTAFGSFVAERGVANIVEELRRAGVEVTSAAVYAWIAGRHFPRHAAVAALVRLSNGRLQLEDVYGHSTTRSSEKP